MRTVAAAPSRFTLRNTAAFFVAALLLAVSLPAAAGAQTAPTGDEVPGRILVKFAPGTSATAKSAARSAAGATKIKSIPQLGVEVLKVPAKASATALQRLQRNPTVTYAEQDRVVELAGVVPNDPEFVRQWGVTLTRTHEVWPSSKGDGVTIAILDTGVTVNSDLDGKVVAGRNILNGTSDATDSHGHGTFSAGVAGSATNNAHAVAGYGWNVRIMPVKVMESSGTMSDLAAGISWAADNGAHIISMSLSGATGTTTVHNAVKYAAGRNVLLVAAAGNQGATDPRYPAAYPEVISVAGSDENDARYTWSNHGSWVDVAAPGVNRSMSRTGSIGSYGGTSSATPAVAGMLALARGTHTNAASIRDALQTAAKPVEFVRYGRVDARAMVDVLAGGTSPTPSPEPTSSPAPEPSPSPSPTVSPAPLPTDSGSPIAVAVTTGKQKGANVATVNWSGSTGTATVFADGEVVGSSTVGTLTHATGQKGGLTVVYQVCDANGCSDKVSASW